jgi:hypothetical protein
MSEFVALNTALEGYFDKTLEDLPGEQRAHVEVHTLLVPIWNMLSPERRRDAARKWDHQHDPAHEQERQAGFALAARELDLEADIAKLEANETSAPSEYMAKRKNLAGLYAELASVRKLSEKLYSRELTPGEAKQKLDEFRIRQWPFEPDASHAASAPGETRALATDRSGSPGRPTTMHLIVAEFERRISQNLLNPDLNAEAEALATWAAKEHPHLARSTAKTIANNIRARYRKINTPKRPK